MNDTVDVNAVLEEAAQATAAAGKKERKPKAEVAGTTVGSAEPKKERKPREPKAPKLYPQWNEDGSPMLGEDGQQVMAETRMKKPKAPKAPRLDADGNPISRAPAVRIPEEGTIHFTEKGAGTVFKAGTKRGGNYTAITEGMTVKDYFEANGGRGVVATFLIWYRNEGLVEIRTA